MRKPIAGVDPEQVRWTGREAWIEAPEGAAILSPADGRIERAAWSAEFGHHVTLRHGDGCWSAFTHLQAPSPLARGAEVRAGDELGRVGQTGARGFALEWHHTGKGGRYLDPRAFLRSPKGIAVAAGVFSLIILAMALILPDTASVPPTLRDDGRRP